jgi:mono/diheme cytochrome c family protein
MRHIKYSIPLISVVALVGVFTVPRPSQAQSQAQDPAGAQLATMKQYCSGCHSDKLKTGGVSFEGITAATVATLTTPAATKP